MAGAGASEINFPNLVRIEVGGMRFTTWLEKLRRDPQSRLCKMFNGQIPIVRASDGTFCIDRDGRHFHHILNFLRDGCPPLGLTRAKRLELLREVEFYGITRLHAILGGTQDPRDPACSSEIIATSTTNTPALGSFRPYRGHQSFLGQRTASSSSTAIGLGCPSAGASGVPMATLPRGDSILLHSAAAAHCAELFPRAPTDTVYVRLRYGHEYSGDWIVSSPRHLEGVEYELHDACLAREPIAAMNKMIQAGFIPCDYPPRAPPVSDFNTDKWAIMMYRTSRRWEASRE